MHRINLVQGDHVAIAQPGSMVSTLLGSCIAVCLHDAVSHVGGMNHFLLGQPDRGERFGAADMQRYGVHAMELLINAMMAKGARRGNLRAHIYGGASVVAGLTTSVGRDNAAFARRFVEMEGIAIGRVDIGGKRARRVEFLPYEGKARVALVDAVVHQAPALLPVAAPAAPRGELELF